MNGWLAACTGHVLAAFMRVADRLDSLGGYALIEAHLLPYKRGGIFRVGIFLR